MQEKSFFTGFGGQGILSLGQVWAFCAMQEGKEVSFFPVYGAEKRGGIAQAHVIISDSEIASPVITKADSVVVMNQTSLPIAESILKPGGLMLLNSSLVKEIPKHTDSIIANIPAFDIAKKIGNEKTANMVMLGALSVLTKALVLKNLELSFKSFFPKSKQHLITINIQAVIE
ncbi:MAG TPA: 2-oxoacid:acceptor oxidoreductase family protein, partial [Treponemataceae bacterium]|nr:2-oxoacid:acceptor oxidoreductase family protein [Treponemataceae bacterium]